MIEKNGSLLNSKEDIILHQVNVQGVMGGGLAYAIASKYPHIENEYEKYVDDIKEENELLGTVCFGKTKDFYIGNCFSQNASFQTDYEALEKCILEVKKYMQENNLKTVAIPYRYGCGIASGNWDIVSKIFEENFENIYIYNIHKEE